MSVSEQPGGRPFTHSNQYQHIQVGGGATAQLGNTFHISQFLADTEVECFFLHTNTQQAEKTRSISSPLQPMRPLTPTTASTNLPASLIRALTYYKIYITGLMEKMDKVCGASSG
jgi:hypothetical protein